MPEKITGVAEVGLNMHNGKSKILRYNTTCINGITLHGEALKDVKSFTYLRSIIDEHGGSDAYVNARIGKARAAYLQLENIWNSKQLSVNQHQGQDFQYNCQDSSTQQPTVGENKPDPSGGRNQEEALEVDRTHIEESTLTAPQGEEEDQRTHEKNGQQLDRTRKEGPGQGGLENAGRRPISQ
ncbi:unnamed protein product [Schistosoma curassoni]|uniref:Uncharacterized protein n=1 Tax=Schistosoma curassoni TaxID=6186 RepID=A0A183L1F5_9TREM|nr:unnamed protein product [Schistosoma curassoni]